VKRLEQAGTIRGYAAILDQAALGRKRGDEARLLAGG
jgi:DNA-binding Lrp family transcriptional regulator